jgi:hypothetical protein
VQWLWTRCDRHAVTSCSSDVLQVFGLGREPAIGQHPVDSCQSDTPSVCDYALIDCGEYGHPFVVLLMCCSFLSVCCCDFVGSIPASFTVLARLR